MRIAFYTLGCKVNQYETQLMTELFQKKGYDIVPFSSEADIYLINSCTVTATSDSKSRKVLHRCRREHPDAYLVFTGCYPQAFPDDVSILSDADYVTGNKDRKNVVDIVDRLARIHQKETDLTPHTRDEEYELSPIESFEERTRAFVKIEDGCERFCAYCIIPKARGFVRSKDLDSLKEELIHLAANGYKEIVLVGINLSSYGKDLGITLLDAIRMACSIDGIERVRLGSLEPELLSDEDILEMSHLPKLCPQFHLALQSGCDETLRRMNRHYDTAEYERIVNRFRECFEDCSITTDLMVGFPGETEEEFESSLAFADRIHFAKTHVFPYSKRSGTRAAVMKDQISEKIKDLRTQKMIALSEKNELEFLSNQIGQKVSVLFESGDQTYSGYTPNYTPVKVQSDHSLTGTIQTVLITGTDGLSCVGTLLQEGEKACQN